MIVAADRFIEYKSVVKMHYSQKV